MTREEFNIALDMSLSKDRVKLCLEYINYLESILYGENGVNIHSAIEWSMFKRSENED